MVVENQSAWQWALEVEHSDMLVAPMKTTGAILLIGVNWGIIQFRIAQEGGVNSGVVLHPEPGVRWSIWQVPRRLQS